MASKKKVRTIEIDKEEITLKRDILGWRVIHPPKDSNGKINLVNLLVGGWNNLILLIVLLLLIFGFMYVYNHDTQQYREVYENPCEYCQVLDIGNSFEFNNEERNQYGDFVS